MTELTLEAAVRSDVGPVRGNNEDAVFASPRLVAVADGNERVGFIASCRPQTAGIATTLTAVALGDDRYALANVGDSRTYLLRDGALSRLTRDDTLVQRLVDTGALTPAQSPPRSGSRPDAQQRTGSSTWRSRPGRATTSRSTCCRGATRRPPGRRRATAL